jgi:hypothetical protein
VHSAADARIATLRNCAVKQAVEGLERQPACMGILAHGVHPWGVTLRCIAMYADASSSVQ